MARVLIVDDDAITLFTYKSVLRLAGHEVATAALGEDGIALARRECFDLVLCDQRLPDVLGLDVVRSIKEACSQTHIVLVTAWSTPELVREAMKNGAESIADKPLMESDLVRVVDGALRRDDVARDSRGELLFIGYADWRWADLVARGACLCDGDPKTIEMWGRGVGVSVSALKTRCEAVEVSAKASLDLVRLLRIVTRPQGARWDLQRRLDIIDKRTADALLRRAGFGGSTARVPRLETFLSHQQLIAQRQPIDALRELLSGAQASPPFDVSELAERHMTQYR